MEHAMAQLHQLASIDLAIKALGFYRIQPRMEPFLELAKIVIATIMMGQQEDVFLAMGSIFIKIQPISLIVSLSQIVQKALHGAVLKNATSTSDRQCTACPGSFYSNDVNSVTCKPHTNCSAGTYTSTMASPTTNRVCRSCDANFTFSTTDNAIACLAVTGRQITHLYLMEIPTRTQLLKHDVVYVKL